LLEQGLRKLHRRCVETGPTLDAQIRGLFAGMDIAAGEAELGAADPCFYAAGRHDAAGDPMLATLETDDVPQPEFGEPEETRAVDRMCLRGPGELGVVAAGARAT
jgi:hypothetical protein